MYKWLTNWIKRDVPITSNQIFDIFPRHVSSAGVTVSNYSIQGLPAFWKGVNLISSKIANSAVRIYKRGPNNSRTRADNHPAYPLLRGWSNPLQSHYEVFRTLVSNAIISGNGYLVIERDTDATPVALWLLDPENTYPLVYFQDYRPTLRYQANINGREYFFDSEDIIHIKGPSAPTGLVGMRLVDVMRENLGLNIATQKYGAVYFKNGGAITNVITVNPGFQNKESVETFRAGLEEKHCGIDNAFKFLLLQNNATFERIPINNEEAQFIESRNFTLVDMANILGLTASKLNGNVATSYSSLESENLALLGDCYSPWLTLVEQQLSKLLREDQQQSMYCEYDRNDLVMLDSTTRIANQMNEYNNGLRSWEELRAEMNLTTIKNPDETWRVPNGVTVEGEEEPAPPAVQQPLDNVQPQSSGGDDEQRALKRILTATTERLITRMKKDPTSTPDKHRPVVEDALPGFSLTWFDNLEAELREVLPEQRSLVIEQLDTYKIVEEMYGTKI